MREDVRRHEAPVWRLDLIDGRRVKLRRLPTADSTHTVWTMLRQSNGDLLARPLCRLGRTIVVEYVEGVPLDRYLHHAPARQRSMVRAVGRLAARLHRLPASSRSTKPPVEYQRLITSVARRLGRRGWLRQPAVAHLESLPLPAAVNFVPTHGDLCPDNIVVESMRRLRAVDEERLADRPAAFELARMVARWPLDAELERTLLAAYDRAGGNSDSFRNNRTFWIASALSTTAVYRLYYGLPGLRAAVGALGALAMTRRVHGEVRSTE